MTTPTDEPCHAGTQLRRGGEEGPEHVLSVAMRVTTRQRGLPPGTRIDAARLPGCHLHLLRLYPCMHAPNDTTLLVYRLRRRRASTPLAGFGKKLTMDVGRRRRLLRGHHPSFHETIIMLQRPAVARDIILVLGFGTKIQPTSTVRGSRFAHIVVICFLILQSLYCSASLTWVLPTSALGTGSRFAKAP